MPFKIEFPNVVVDPALLSIFANKERAPYIYTNSIVVCRFCIFFFFRVLMIFEDAINFFKGNYKLFQISR